MEELGLNSRSTINSTYMYEAQDVTADEVIQSHASALDDLLNIKLHDVKIGGSWLKTTDVSFACLLSLCRLNNPNSSVHTCFLLLG